MKVEIVKEGKKEFVQITLPLIKETSKSGKSILVATTSGNKPSELKVDGKTVTVGCNAYIAVG